MFSPSIQRLIDQQGGAEAVYKRVSQLEGILKSQNEEELKTFDPPKIQSPKFSDYIKQSSSLPDLKFKLSEPPKVSRAEIQNIVQAASKKHGVDERLVLAVINQESGFKSDAISKAGAQGLMQLMPKTASNLGVKNPFDPVQNVEGGTKYLKQMLNKYNGNVILALAAYNAGPKAVDDNNGVPPYKETQNYVKSVLSKYVN